MSTQDEENAPRILSVRVSENIYRAYEQIQMRYAVKQSDLIRMAPLLLVLLAEGNLARRQKEVRKWEAALRSGQEIDWNKFRKIDRERTAIENNEILGRGFINHLRDLAGEAGREDVINPTDIEEAEDGLPKYLIFQKQVLRQAAHEIADKVSLNEIPSLISDADNPYDGQLLAVSGKKLGKALNDRQKEEVRHRFKEALEIRGALGKHEMPTNDPSGVELREAAYEVARNRVRPEDIQILLGQIGSEEIPEIPRRYDGQLLAISRKKLGKPLNLGEKATVRKLFHEALKTIKRHTNSLVFDE
ncbi:MAG: hypothetical protein OXN84_07290 [Albidovulum sp.]|nr:hypothetical protein [Albidovulum sp.]